MGPLTYPFSATFSSSPPGHLVTDVGAVWPQRMEEEEAAAATEKSADAIAVTLNAIVDGGCDIGEPATAAALLSSGNDGRDAAAVGTERRPRVKRAVATATRCETVTADAAVAWAVNARDGVVRRRGTYRKSRRGCVEGRG